MRDASLARVAAQMTAPPTDCLTDGKLADLHLTFARIDGARKLRIGRIDKPPTQGQVRAVLAAFGAPEDSVIAAGRVKTQQPGTARWAVLHYAEVNWREVAHAPTIARAGDGR